MAPTHRCLALCLAVLTAAALAARGEDSLYNSRHARVLAPGERSFFGPRSAGVYYDARMIRAAEIAKLRANPHMTWRCWKYVKDALLASGVVASRPTSAWAKQAGDELCHKFGFIPLKIRDPRKAPIGAVVVYGGPDAGHVELRTKEGFVSDFVSAKPYPRPLVGVYVKPS